MRNPARTLSLMTLTVGIGIGLAAAMAVPAVQAALSGPREHKNVDVGMLAELSEQTLEKTIGLEGYTLRMRTVGIAPGGHIAQHSHEDRPGIVTMVQGEWIEGRPTGERTFSASTMGTIEEDENTVHWVYNRTSSPTTALVCDLAKVPE